MLGLLLASADVDIIVLELRPRDDCRLHAPADRLQVPGLHAQWDFLDFLASRTRSYPAFRLMMNAEATSLISRRRTRHRRRSAHVGRPRGDPRAAHRRR
jgi:hypothetical protein